MLIKLEHKKYYFVLFSAVHAGIADPRLVYYPSLRGVGLWSCSNQDPRGFVLKPGLSSTVLGKLGCDPFEVQAGRLAYRETGFISSWKSTQKLSVTETKKYWAYIVINIYFVT